MTVDAATKVAIHNLARIWTLELKDRRIRVLVRITKEAASYLSNELPPLQIRGSLPHLNERSPGELVSRPLRHPLDDGKSA